MKISLGESQWPQTAEVWHHLNRQSVQVQHACCPQSPRPGSLGFSFLLVSLFILSTFFCSWTSWTSSAFSSPCWKWLPLSFWLSASWIQHCTAWLALWCTFCLLVFQKCLLLPWESRCLGHRGGNSATAAGISVREKKKKNRAAEVRFPKSTNKFYREYRGFFRI